jgi:malate dehydrogenase
VSYLGSGSAFYAPSAGIFKMVNAVINNTRETIATSCFLQGEYGIEDVYLGVPAVIGNNGIEKIIEIPLTKDEDEQLKAACESIQQQLKALNL